MKAARQGNGSRFLALLALAARQESEQVRQGRARAEARKTGNRKSRGQGRAAQSLYTYRAATGTCTGWACLLLVSAAATAAKTECLPSLVFSLLLLLSPETRHNDTFIYLLVDRKNQWVDR
jgi:hypothetical protein